MNSDKPSFSGMQLLLGVAMIVLTSVISALICYRYYYTKINGDVKQFLDSAYKIERGYIEHIPLYDDYATPVMEQKLRTYLFPAHMSVAAKSGMAALERNEELTERIASGALVRLEQGPGKLYYFYNVRDRYRVLSPGAVRGLTAITARFQQNIAARTSLTPVKIALSSLMRPASYQTSLRETNGNATPLTSHSYGISFDIFYDEYFVDLPGPASPRAISRAILDRVRTRIGFLLGESLRGQFRSVLLETLIQLQDEGVLYAILEKRQRCYHVTILQ